MSQQIEFGILGTLEARVAVGTGMRRSRCEGAGGVLREDLLSRSPAISQCNRPSVAGRQVLIQRVGPTTSSVQRLHQQRGQRLDQGMFVDQFGRPADQTLGTADLQLGLGPSDDCVQVLLKPCFPRIGRSLGMSGSTGAGSSWLLGGANGER